MRCSARTVLIPTEEVLFLFNPKLKNKYNLKMIPKTNVVLNKNKEKSPIRKIKLVYNHRIYSTNIKLIKQITPVQNQDVVFFFPPQISLFKIWPEKSDAHFWVLRSGSFDEALRSNTWFTHSQQKQQWEKLWAKCHILCFWKQKNMHSFSLRVLFYLRKEK